METLPPLITISKDIYTTPNKSITVDLNSYILGINGTSIVFSTWQCNGVNIKNGINTIPSTGTINIVKSSINTTFTSSGVYEITAVATSTLLNSLNTTISFNIYVIDPSSTTNNQITLINLTPTTVPLPANVLQINDITIYDSIYRNVDISIELEQSSILITALRTFTSEIDVKLTLDNATTMYLILTQSSPSNNVVVNGQSYSGNLYSISATITSYTIVGQTSTYLPGVQYSFSGGGIQINSDGSYSVNSTVPITFQILYSGGTITLEVKASPPKSIYITIPSYSLTMGSNIISVKVAGTFLSQGISYSNTSGEFTWNNNILQILDITPNFIPTSVQVEDSSPALLNVIDYQLSVLSIASTVQTLTVPLGYTVPNSTTIKSLPIAYEISQPTSVLFNGITFQGSSVVFDVYDASNTKICNVSIAMQLMTITPYAPGVSGAITIINASSTTYYMISVIPAVISTNVNMNFTMTANSNQTFNVLGDSTNVLVGSGALNRTVVNSGTSLLISPNYIPTSIYTFYATTSDFLYYIFTIQYSMITLYMTSFLQFPISLITSSAGPYQFSDPSITVSEGFVLNPNSLGTFVMLLPSYTVINLQV